jgi:hypothetical protein
MASYEKDPEFQEIWRLGGQEDWGFFRLNWLLWKEVPADARLCVPAGADRTKILAQSMMPWGILASIAR